MDVSYPTRTPCSPIVICGKRDPKRAVESRALSGCVLLHEETVHFYSSLL